MNVLTFRDLAIANEKRQREWPGDEHCDTLFRAVEVAGECGELMEAVKKYTRAKRGIKGSMASIIDVADEMGDLIIAVSLLANDLNVDLEAAVRSKFNKTSMKHDLKTRLL